VDTSGHLSLDSPCPVGCRSSPNAVAPAAGRLQGVMLMAGGLCVAVLLVALVAASLALDLHGYLAARRHGKPRHGRKRRRK
jgi:hypothetical protein